MSGLKVLIAGASIAGPTAAYWFARAGADVTVIERWPTLRPGGQNIDIRTAGVTVMRKTPGMEAAVRAKTTSLEGIGFVDDKGRPFAIMKSTGDAEQQSLVSEFEIFRGDLAEILYDLTKNNERVKYIFGEQVVSIRQSESGTVTVDFANGLPTSTYDLVVAADGSTSRTRAIGFECGVRDHIKGLNYWSAYFSIKDDLLQGGKIGLAHSAVGGRFVSLGPDPAGISRAAMQKIHPREENDATLPFQEALKQGTDALKNYVATVFEGSGWKTNEIIEGMMKSDEFYASEIVQVKMPSLSRGRFVLVGDAGYAAGPTGGGTSLALAGAYILAGEIAQHKDDVAAGLAAYEARMKPIIEDMQQIPSGVPYIMAPQTAWGIWARDWLFTIVCYGMKLSGAFSWLTSFWASSFGKDKYNIPDYDWVD